MGRLLSGPFRGRSSCPSLRPGRGGRGRRGGGRRSSSEGIAFPRAASTATRGNSPYRSRSRAWRAGRRSASAVARAEALPSRFESILPFSALRPVPSLRCRCPLPFADPHSLSPSPCRSSPTRKSVTNEIRSSPFFALVPLMVILVHGSINIDRNPHRIPAIPPSQKLIRSTSHRIPRRYQVPHFPPPRLHSSLCASASQLLVRRSTLQTSTNARVRSLLPHAVYRPFPHFVSFPLSQAGKEPTQPSLSPRYPLLILQVLRSISSVPMLAGGTAGQFRWNDRKGRTMAAKDSLRLWCEHRNSCRRR